MLMQRLSKSTVDQLKPRALEMMGCIERAMTRLPADQLVEQLLHLAHMTRHTRSQEAYALILDELYHLQLYPKHPSPIWKSLHQSQNWLRQFRFRKKTSPECVVLGICAEQELGLISIEEARSQMGIRLSQTECQSYSAYTLSRLLPFYSAGRRRSAIIELLSTRLNELEGYPLALSLVHAANFLGANRQFKNLWRRVEQSLNATTVRSLPTHHLISYLGVWSREEFVFLDGAGVDSLLTREDRHLFHYLLPLSQRAESIARTKSLHSLVREELATLPQDSESAIMVASDLARHRIVPMDYLARQVGDLRAHLDQLNPLMGTKLIAALAALGMVERPIFDHVLGSLSSWVGHSPMIFWLPDVLWSAAICDLHCSTNWTETLLEIAEPVIEEAHEDIGDRMLIQLHRAAGSIGRTLPGAAGSRASRIVANIRLNRPRQDQPEDDFIALLRRALPDAHVAAEGFAHSHHFDAEVQIGDRRIDAELDGRVHETFDLLGRSRGRRGEDDLRDRLITLEGFEVLRFTHSELQREDVIAHIQRRFGLE